jgi:hypothetical protein
MTIYKIKAGRIITVAVENYIGEKGQIFYDENIGELRLSNGVTPGGISITSGGGSGNGYTGSQGPPGPQGISITLLGSVNAIEDLPNSNNTQGDAYLNLDDGNLYVWSGETWTNTGQIVGYTGSAGSNGYTGSAGSNGYTGSAGSNGYTGSAGSNGYTGSAGSNGYTGSAGSNGYTGSAGSNGYTGSAGSNGSTGYTGSAGLVNGLTSNNTDTIIVNAGYSIIPATNGLQNLGSPTNRFGTTYVGTNSIDIGGTVFSAGEEGRISIKNSNNEYTGFVLSDIAFGNNESSVILRATSANGLEMILNPGSQSETAFSVAIGYTGSQGVFGYTGSQGAFGYTGSQGIGFTGSQGQQGLRGYTGSGGGGGGGGGGGSVFGNLDGGVPDSNYGGIASIDAGGVSE